jgi:hypothetical protein
MNSARTRLCAAAALLSLAVAAAAADKVDDKTHAGANKEAAADSDSMKAGITIYGQKDSPLGLFITPWKNAYADKRLGRPKQPLDDQAEPLDPNALHREVTYDRLIKDYRAAEQTGGAPAAH